MSDLISLTSQIFTARDPYPRNVDLEDEHSQGQLPVRPQKEFIHINDALWAFLERCWSSVPDLRPSAAEVMVELITLSSDS